MLLCVSMCFFFYDVICVLCFYVSVYDFACLFYVSTFLLSDCTLSVFVFVFALLGFYMFCYVLFVCLCVFFCVCLCLCLCVF